MPTPPSGRPLNRRSFIASAAAATVLAACGGSDSTPASPEPGGPGLDDTLWLQAGFADGFRVPTTLMVGRPERAPFAIFGSDGLPAVNGVPDAVDMTLTAPDGTSEVIEVVRRDAMIPTPHYPLVFTPELEGTYAVEAEIGGEAQRVEFVVAGAGGVALVAPGDQMRSLDTPTFDDARGYDPICTRFEPCPFHEVNLADAVGSGQPTALLIATPGFCQTVICGPVVELLMDIDPADMNVIHGEVYTEPDRLGEVNDLTSLIGPIVTTFDMDFEPSFVVADADGIVTARLDYTFDRDEMEAALATVL